MAVKLIRFFFGSLLFFELYGLFGLAGFRPQYSWLGLLLTLLVSWGALEIINYYFKKHYQTALPAFLWILTAVALFLDFWGDIGRLYDAYFYYDYLMHFLGGGLTVSAVSFWAISRLNHFHSLSWSKLFIVYFIFSAALSAGFLYEAFEYLSDRALGTHNLGDRFDTTEDLFFNLLGALLLTIPILFGIL